MHAPAPNALVVRTDRRAIDRFFRPRVIAIAICLGVIVLCLVGLVALLVSTSSSGAGLPSSSATIVVIAIAVSTTSTLQLVTFVRQWRRMRAIEVRVVADDGGLRAILPGLDAHVPWHAVHHARIQGTGPRHRMTVDVDAGAIVGVLPDSQRRRIARRGLSLSALGMQPGLDAVAHAVVVGTRGRVQPVAV